MHKHPERSRLTAKDAATGDTALNKAIAEDIQRIRKLQGLTPKELADRAGLHGEETVEALEDPAKHKAHQLPQLEAVYRYLLGQEGRGLEPKIVEELRKVRMRIEVLLKGKLKSDDSDRKQAA